ncbi:hypothetical protein CCAX7_007220 [Capsulimonas corticalis]|uniref:Uncharacterized protein n=1 Tax=Capsulimonas corticalis TaxID=2219043 RepID=A0A402D1M3_9BACT|nr:Uma2 family endonuclease [Capsulimonas corticalis]BDI28671.1 hypothetical protein CCAX7_007220 [Capsulimonas corticalis]
MATQARRLHTPDEYLSMERQAEVRSEYIRGEIFAMSGASLQHTDITLNVGSELRMQLKGKPYRASVSDLRVQVGHAGLYTYPDIVVTCGAPQFADAHVDTVLNPTLIAEVPSPSTESYDRGEKSIYYRQIPTLKQYLLISQNRPHIELYTRQAEDSWLLTEISNLDGAILLECISCTLAMSEIYDRVVFETRAK